MSKPQPLEYTLNHFVIEYGVGRFDVGVHGPDPANWHVQVSWYVKGNKEVSPQIQEGSFKTYSEVVDYIEKETGVMIGQTN